MNSRRNRISSLTLLVAVSALLLVNLKSSAPNPPAAPPPKLSNPLAAPAMMLPVRGDNDEEYDRSLSPYFLIKNENGEIDQFPLQSTTGEVAIAGTVAEVTVMQTYKNDGVATLEASYIFPASTRAAVHGMRMTIGERTIEAKIDKREKARQDYERARQQGRSASLLEQQRPNVFQMNVGNILPGDVIKVELKYTELLAPVDGVYSFVYPTVVGPRYASPFGEQPAAGDGWIQNPYTQKGEPPSYSFDLDIRLSTGVPIEALACRSHNVDIDFEDKSRARIQLDESEAKGGNRDFILDYRLTGDQIETGLLLYEGTHENFFLLMMQPPERVRAEQIPPREYVFVMDVSGSMRGFPLTVSKNLLHDLIANLRPVDTFNILQFAGGSSVLADSSLPATHHNIQQGIDFIQRSRGGGGTELLPALERALKLPRVRQTSRTIVIATDGYVSVEDRAFKMVRANLNQANLFAFGIGSSVNRYLIEGLARAGMGSPFVITTPERAATEAARFRRYIESPVLTNTKLDFGEFEVYDLEPPSLPDLFAERPVIVFGKWRGPASGTILLSGDTGGQSFRTTIEVASAKPSTVNAALPYLWARHRIQVLTDDYNLRENDEIVEQVTSLGLAYNLLTSFTSFIAIDSEVRQSGGMAASVKQPLPLPQGVPNQAVGGGLYAKSTAKWGLHSGYTSQIESMQRTVSEPSSQPNWLQLESTLQAPSEANDRGTKVTAHGRVELELLMTNINARKAVAERIQQKMEDLELVYDKYFHLDHQLQGRLILEISIDTHGSVTVVEAKSDDIEDQNFIDEIKQKIGSWRLGEIESAAVIGIAIQFVPNR